LCRSPSGNQGSTGGEWQPTSLTLSDGTNSATVSALAINPGGSAYQDSGGQGFKDTVLTGGWVFFDIDADGTYAVSGTQRTDTIGYSIGALTFDSVPVPEPSTLALLVVAGIGILLRRRRS